MFAKKPLAGEERRQQLKNTRLSIYFGDKDWMARDGYENLLSANTYSDECKYYTVKDSDHHMYFDNP